MRFAEALETIVATIDRSDFHDGVRDSVPTDQCLPGFSLQNPLPILPLSVAARPAGSCTRTYPRTTTPSTTSPPSSRAPALHAVSAGCDQPALRGPDHFFDGGAAGESHRPHHPATRRSSHSSRLGEDKALIAELGGGDALYIRKLPGGIRIEATAPFNGLVNYWWDAFSIGPDAPYTSLLLSMITIAERPLAERKAWTAFFDHYVFRSQRPSARTSTR